MLYAWTDTKCSDPSLVSNVILTLVSITSTAADEMPQAVAFGNPSLFASFPAAKVVGEVSSRRPRRANHVSRTVRTAWQGGFLSTRMSACGANCQMSVANHALDGGLNDLTVCHRHSLALLGGIKEVAVGKFGVRPIQAESLPAIVDALAALEAWEASEALFGLDTAQGLKANPVENARLDLQLQRASLLGALFVKAKISPSEMRILKVCSDGTRRRSSGLVREVDGQKISVGDILSYITAPLPRSAITSGESVASHAALLAHEPDLAALDEYAASLLSGASLSVDRAEHLGRVLYNHRHNTSRVLQLKALIAHVMRIRHESTDELTGLAIAASSSAGIDAQRNAHAGQSVSTQGKFAFLAEPFDGSVTWDLLTPLLSRYLRQNHGFNVVLGTGASSGPKYGPNLRDVALELGIPFAKDTSEVMAKAQASEFGVAVDQADISPGLAMWVRIRRAILKRPALATVEKYVDITPGRASLFISSAFHTSYVEKMAAIAEALGYASYIIVSKGVEGCIGVGGDGRRSASFLVGVKNCIDGSYVRTEVSAPRVTIGDAEGYGGDQEANVPAKGSATADRVADLTLKFVRDGRSGDACFDARVAATCSAFDAALDIARPTLLRK